jgi:hypothetical protein
MRDALGYWGIQRAKSQQRKFVEKELAEGEELGSNLLCAPGRPAGGCR